MRAPSMTLKRFRLLADYEQLFEALHREVAAGHGAIVACPHTGSWELAGAGVVLAGLPLFSIAGRQRNPLFDAYLNRTRERMGFEMATRGSGTMRTIIRNLKACKILAVLPDVRMPTEAVRVNFLGREANVGAGMALFARHADVPIYPVINLRRQGQRHVGRVHPAIRPDPTLDKDADVRRMTQAVFDIFSAAILAEPGQWFWYNKRWIFDPIDQNEQPATSPSQAPDEEENEA